MSDAKRQHYVPKMHLRRWEDGLDSDHVYVLDRHEQSEPRRAHVNQVTVIGHFYTLNRDREDEERNLLIEEVLSDVEDDAKAGIDRLLAGDPKLAGSVIPWLFFQLLRTPQGQAFVADDHVAQLRQAAGEPGGLIPFWIKRKGRTPDGEEVMRLATASAAIATGMDHPLLRPDATTVLKHMLDLVMHHEFGHRLRDEGKWNTLLSDPDAFVLGDHPVTYSGSYNPTRPIWRQEELPRQITLPLDPATCLEIRAAERVDALSLDEIDQINLRAWHWSDRWLIARSPEPLLRLCDLAASKTCRTPPPTTVSARRRR